MRTNKPGWIAAAVLGGLLACSITVSAQDTNAPSSRPKKGATIEARMEHLDELLSLTDAEKPKVKAALEAFAAQRREARGLADDERQTKMQAAQADLNKSMKEILTPEQYDKWTADVQKGKKGGKKSQGSN